MATADHARLDELRRVRQQLAHARRRNVIGEFDQSSTLGQHAADAFANVIGSWRFIIIQSCILAGWIVLNVTAAVRHWDPYPFILLNLALSFQAAYAGPIIMMSQNRAAQLDRLQAHADYDVNQKAKPRSKSCSPCCNATPNC
ncbi:MAG: DUF1003 domain-containing protein [Egibacteraceae bacterium]